jgi:hypothetical protein
LVTSVHDLVEKGKRLVMVLFYPEQVHPEDRSIRRKRGVFEIAFDVTAPNRRVFVSSKYDDAQWREQQGVLDIAFIELKEPVMEVRSMQELRRIAIPSSWINHYQ